MIDVVIPINKIQVQKCIDNEDVLISLKDSFLLMKSYFEKVNKWYLFLKNIFYYLHLFEAKKNYKNWSTT